MLQFLKKLIICVIYILLPFQILALDCLQNCHKIATSPNEKASLVKFYNKLQGLNWRKKWDLTNDPCQNFWYGIQCDQDGHIIQIDLIENSLSGSITTEIDDLTWLKEIYISNHALTVDGTELKFANKITDFTFSNTLTNLHTIQMPNIGLQTVTGWETLTNLKIIDFSNNAIAQTIPNVNTLCNLEILDLSENKYKGNFPTFHVCQGQLEKINLSNNLITGSIPFYNLAKLKYLDIRENKIIGTFPTNYFTLPQFVHAGIIFNSDLVIPSQCEISLFCFKEHLVAPYQIDGDKLTGDIDASTQTKINAGAASNDYDSYDDL